MVEDHVFSKQDGVSMFLITPLSINNLISKILVVKMHITDCGWQLHLISQYSSSGVIES